MKLKRDGQQWMFDWMVQETGRVFHFQLPNRGGLPPSVRTHEMISKHVGRAGGRLMALAESELGGGHRATALEHYFDAASTFAAAQHTIFELDDEKRTLHAAALRCYEKVRELAPYSIERITAKHRDGVAYGYLHVNPELSGPAPCVIMIPGCDMTKEMYPHPSWNQAHRRGMHILVLDGPGQGESNMDGTPLRPDNYPLAVSAMLDELIARPEIDGEQIGVYGMSYGSYWALQSAAHDDRLAACVGSWTSAGDPRHLMDRESPRYKQLFAFLTQASDEAELDAITDQMDIRGSAGGIACPTLLTVGEFDPRSPLDEIEAVFDEMSAPRELWVFEDQHHMCSVTGRPVVESQIWHHDSHSTVMDWLADRLVAAAPLAATAAVRTFGTATAGPGAGLPMREPWFDSLR